jgi:hypothetical protein
MSPLYLLNGKLLIKDSKLATNANCCCYICKQRGTCSCAGGLEITYQQLWTEVQKWITLVGSLCEHSGIVTPIVCGEWKPNDAYLSRGCCTQQCYDIWYRLLTDIGYDEQTINSTSPAQFDILCSGTTLDPAQVPGLPIGIGSCSGFAGIPFDRDYDYEYGRYTDSCIMDKYKLFMLSIDPKLSGLPVPRARIHPTLFYFSDGFSREDRPVTSYNDIEFAHIKIDPLAFDGNLCFSNTEQNVVTQLFSSGSYAPYSGTTYYENRGDCIRCFGSLYKLGTPDFLDRDTTESFMSGCLMNQTSGDMVGYTEFFIGTNIMLSGSECTQSRFKDDIPIKPYGILLNELGNPDNVFPEENRGELNNQDDSEYKPGYMNPAFTPSDIGNFYYEINTIKSSTSGAIVDDQLFSDNPYDYFYEFEVSYKYAITWDNPDSLDPPPVYYPFTNKWNIKYGPIYPNPNYTPRHIITSHNANYENDPRIPRPSEWWTSSKYYQSDSVLVSDYNFKDILLESGVHWGTTMTLKWDSPIFVGNNNYDYEDIPFRSISGTTFPPVITLSTTGLDTGATFSPILIEKLGVWSISGVEISGNANNYENNQKLKIEVSDGDTIEENAIIKLLTQPSGTISDEQPSLIAKISGSNQSANITTTWSKLENNHWQPSFELTNKGANYSDLIIPIVFHTGIATQTVIPSVGSAVLNTVVPTFTINIITSTGSGAQLNINNILKNIPEGPYRNPWDPADQWKLRPKSWFFEFRSYAYPGEGPWISTGSGYTNQDYIEIIVQPESTILGNNVGSTIQRSAPNIWRINLDVNNNGSIKTVFPGLPINPYTENFCLKTQQINSIYFIDTIGYYDYYEPPRTTYGEYYRESLGEIPATILIENSGKYYREMVDKNFSIKPISGPCIKNIKMDIWHPGPCGINEELKAETSIGTPWESPHSGMNITIQNSELIDPNANFLNTKWLKNHTFIDPQRSVSSSGYDLDNQYLLLFKEDTTLKYRVKQVLSNTRLKLETLAGEPAYDEINSNNSYYIGGKYYGNLEQFYYFKTWQNDLGVDQCPAFVGSYGYNYIINPGGSELYNGATFEPMYWEYACPCGFLTNMVLRVIKTEACNAAYYDNDKYFFPREWWTIYVQHDGTNLLTNNSFPLKIFKTSCQESTNSNTFFCSMATDFTLTGAAPDNKVIPWGTFENYGVNPCRYDLENDPYFWEDDTYISILPSTNIELIDDQLACIDLEDCIANGYGYYHHPTVPDYADMEDLSIRCDQTEPTGVWASGYYITSYSLFPCSGGY